MLVGQCNTEYSRFNAGCHGKVICLDVQGNSYNAYWLVLTDFSSKGLKWTSNFKSVSVSVDKLVCIVKSCLFV